MSFIIVDRLLLPYDALLLGFRIVCVLFYAPDLESENFLDLAGQCVRTLPQHVKEKAERGPVLPHGVSDQAERGHLQAALVAAHPTLPLLMKQWVIY